jgi:hypothetical protein
MKRSLLVAVLLSLALPWANSASAADCICPKYPYYPYGGGNWFHYATFHQNDNCGNSTPTGYIGPMSPMLNCGPNCSTCIALADELPELQVIKDLKGFDKKLTPAAADVADDAALKAFMEKIQPATNPAEWAQLEFVKSDTIQISRKTKETPPIHERFAIVLYKVTYNGQEGPGGIGIQVNETPSGHVYIPRRFKVPCTENGKKVFETALGVIKVYHRGEWWMVRLDDSDANETGFAFPVSQSP